MSRPKKLVKSNKSISRNFFSPNSIFCNFKNGQKSIFELEKSLKLPKIQFHEKMFFDLFDFTSIFAWTFFNFLTRGLIIDTWTKFRPRRPFSIYWITFDKFPLDFWQYLAKFFFTSSVLLFIISRSGWIFFTFWNVFPI